MKSKRKHRDSDASLGKAVAGVAISRAFLFIAAHELPAGNVHQGTVFLRAETGAVEYGPVDLVPVGAPPHFRSGKLQEAVEALEREMIQDARRQCC
jgi:hypothetical protein